MSPRKTFTCSADHPLDQRPLREPFGHNDRGEPVCRYTLTNRNGTTASVMNHGATLLSLALRDACGGMTDVMLGHDTAAAYNRKSAFFGSTVGRYAGRIRGGTFTLDGRTYQIDVNDGANTLHGGSRGFDAVVWREGPACSNHQIELLYTSPDGDLGFPGQVEVSVTYRLSDHDALCIEYRATSDAPTPINLTNHAYFNLSGHDAGDCLDHHLAIDAAYYLPIDNQLIPTGERRPVQNTVFDFRGGRRIGDFAGTDDEQIRLAGGYDHTFCLDTPPDEPLRPAMRVTDPGSGRSMTVATTEPGVQLYTGNQLHPGLTGKGGCRYERHGGFCLETQHYPDSPNQPDFPDTMLHPGTLFRSTTIYQFFGGGRPDGSSPRSPESP
jgi:aldose 1-epimerase